MQQQEIDLLDAELARALVEGVQRGLVAVIADPDLGLDEHVRGGSARAADAVPNFALVAVRGRGVDQSVADAQRRLDGRGGLLGRGLEDAESKRRHLDAVVQVQGGGHDSSCTVGRTLMRSARPSATSCSRSTSVVVTAPSRLVSIIRR
jgi:hypothetical protein